MKYLKKLILFLAVAFFLTSLNVNHCFAASDFNIGVIDDCSSKMQNRLIDDIKEEILSLTKGEFNVQFPTEFTIISDCNETDIKSNIEKLFSNPDIDMILALGPISSHLLSQYKEFSKPCIAGVIINPELYNVPFSNNKSGKHNFSYVLFSTDIVGSINQFREISSFNNAAFLYDSSRSKSIISKSGQHYLDKIKKDIGIDLTLIPVGKKIEPVINLLKDSSIEAVFLSDLDQLDAKQLSNLISYFNNNKIASFSFRDRVLIEKGLLAGFDQTSEKNRFSRRIALFTQRILLKEDPKNFKVGFSTEGNLMFNMETANKLGVSPTFALLTNAEVINSKSFITPAPSPLQDDKKQTGTPAQEIKLSSLVAGESNDLNESELGLAQDSQSMSLIDAVKLALETNLSLKSKAKETEASKMDVKEALSNFYPQLSTGLRGSMIDEDRTSAVSGVAERSWDISAQVSQLLYSSEAHTYLKTTRHLQKVQEFSENQTRLDIILETSIAYLDILKARANTKIQLENLKLIRANLGLANNRYKAGSSSPSDVYRLESEAANAYANLLASLARIGKARIKLNQILNLNLEEDSTIQDLSLDDSMFIVSDPKMKSNLNIRNLKDFKLFRDSMVTKGLKASPELKAINEQIMIQNELYASAKRSYWSPIVSVNGNAGNTFSKSGEGSDFDNSSLPSSLQPYFEEPDDDYWELSLNISIPFYEGGAKSARATKALETSQQLKFFKYDVQNQISENIRIALLDMSASYPAIELTRLSARSAKKNLDLVQDSYTKGSVSIVDFLDAQNASLVANTLAENAVYDFFIDFIASERAAGQYTFLMDKEEKGQWLYELQK
jgi:outer membrane protein